MDNIYKFRGVNVVSNEWIYGKLLTKNNESFIVREEETSHGFDGEKELLATEWSITEVIPKSVGQFINIHTTEDDELYEGHMINICIDGKLIIATIKVEFSTPIICSHEFPDGYEYVFSHINTDDGYAWLDCEIIGNEYDIPVLEVK